MALRAITERTNPAASVAQRLRDVVAYEAATRGERFELVTRLRNEHGWSWQQIGAELGITKQGALKVYAAHAAQNARRTNATDRARFETVQPSAPVASPASDVPLDLD